MFFDSYIGEVREFLAENPGAVGNSGPWSEVDANGIERNFAALSFLLGDQLVIQLKLIDTSQLYHQAVFQKAREYSMNYEALLKERERKEVLLHTIVHDLAGPLTAITGVLDLLAGKPDDVALVSLALKQCDVEREMIRSIMDTFSAELEPFSGESLSRDRAPDIRELIVDTHRAFSPAFASQDVRFEFVDRLPSGPVPVVAETDLLSRVLSNLLQNALRFSPRDSLTSILLEGDPGRIRVSIIDQGEGVPPHRRDEIFERFVGGRGHGGSSGIGLYFCRITVEKWEGSIGCDSGTGGDASGQGPGSTFWFELKRL